MPCSAIILRAAGSAVAEAACAGAPADAVCGAGLADSVAPEGAEAAAPFASVSMIAMTSCPTTVEPSPFRISASAPDTGAGSSSTTLSVSTSIRFSSRLTASPGFLCQLTSVASVTDSGSCGTLTSTRMSMLSVQDWMSISPSESSGAKATSISFFWRSTCFDM